MFISSVIYDDCFVVVVIIVVIHIVVYVYIAVPLPSLISLVAKQGSIPSLP